MEPYNIVTRSEIGARIYQQDALNIEQQKEDILAVVCDGMGGLDRGELASELVVNTLSKAFLSCKSNQDIYDFYYNIIDILDEKVFHLSKKVDDVKHAGTTLCSIVIQKNQLYWLSVGDTRCYIIRGNEIVQVTRDHNYKMILDQQKHILSSQSNFDEKERQDSLISYIGMGGIEIYDQNKKPFILETNDIVLVTTDGLYKALSDKDILNIIKQSSNLEEASDELCRKTKAIAKEKQDNTSFIIIQMVNKT